MSERKKRKKNSLSLFQKKKHDQKKKRTPHRVGCSQYSNTLCAYGHSSPLAHPPPDFMSGHAMPVYRTLGSRGSRRRAFSPACANGHEVQSWTKRLEQARTWSFFFFLVL